MVDCLEESMLTLSPLGYGVLSNGDVDTSPELRLIRTQLSRSPRARPKYFEYPEIHGNDVRVCPTTLPHLLHTRRDEGSIRD